MDIHEHVSPRREGSAALHRSLTVQASHIPAASSGHNQPIPRLVEQEVQGPMMRQRGRNFKELRKMGAVDFYGTVDPAEAEIWLKRTERVFNQMGCILEERFDYAVSLLQGNAYNWWETVPHAMIQPPVLSWDDFLREFSDKYMPRVYRDEKQKEFLSLKQGVMSVADYEVKFTQLSRYAYALLPTEQDKCRHFEGGLIYKIRSKITPSDLHTYSDLRTSAIRAERLVKERHVYLQRQKRGPPQYAGESSSRFPRQQGSFSSASSFSRGGLPAPRDGHAPSLNPELGRGSGMATHARPLCVHCGRQHMGECRTVTGGCYHCGQQGLYYRECPFRPNRIPSDRAMTEQTVQNERPAASSTGFGQGRGRGQAISASIGRGRGQSEAQGSTPQGHARVFATTQDEASRAPEVITGTLYLYETMIHTLKTQDLRIIYITNHSIAYA